MYNNAMDILTVVSKNLKRIREKEQLSIADLERKSGVGKATISSLESGRGNPTVETLWALADALNVPFGMLVSRSSLHQNAVIRSEEGATVTGDSGYTRLVEKVSSQGPLEIYEMVLSPNQKRVANPHPKGVVEHLLVVQGWLHTGIEDELVVLGKGDFISFRGDLPHIYAAMEDEARAIVWMQYPAHLNQTPTSGNLELNYTDDLPASVEPEYWHHVQKNVEQSWIEIMNGLAMKRLRFLAEPWNTPSIIRSLETCRETLQRNTQYRWYIQSFIVKEENHVSLISFPRHQSLGISPTKGDQEILINQSISESVAEKIQALYRYICHSPGRDLTPSDINFLQKYVNDPSLVIRTLVSEVLTQNGYPIVQQDIHVANSMEDKT